MTAKNIDKQLKPIVEKIVREYKPEKIILFGSYAWGKPHKDSDFDLFIVKKSRDRRIDREREVQQFLFDYIFPIDILVYTPEEIQRRLNLEDFFIQDVIQKGKVLYSIYDRI